MLQSKQVGEVLRALKTNLTEADIRKLVQSQKNDDRISFEEFLPIFQAVSTKKITDTADDFVEGLRHFDKVTYFFGLKALFCDSVLHVLVKQYIPHVDIFRFYIH
jgi:hypothetical protein